MIVLLALIACFGGAAAYMTGREVRAALEARPRDRNGLLRRRPPTPAAPAEHRSLDKPPACAHSSRPAAVVPYAHNAPVAWVCPDCDATVPEPPPLGPRDGRRQAYADGFIDPQLRGPGARSDRDTASSLSGTVSTGSTRITNERHSIRQALDAAQERVRTLSHDFEHDGHGNFVVSKDQYAAYSAACASVKELRAHLAAMPEPPETYEERSPQSDAPVRTYTALAPLTGYEAAEWSQGEMLAALGIPGPSMGTPDDFRRSNYAVLLHHAGHTPNEIRRLMAEWDVRQTTATPQRALTPTTTDDRPTPGWTLPH